MTKMKRYNIKFGLIIFAILLFFSCNNEFLERYPLDEISNETFWNSENDLKVYNNSLYNMARNDDNVPILMGHDEAFKSHKISIWHLDGFSDNTAPRHSRHNYYQRLRAGKHAIPGNPGAQWFGWKGWNFLRACNVGLENYDKADIAQSVKDRYKGEARLFRGWFYADKVSKFGDVPWVDKELTTESEELFGPRTPREDVMENVLADLNFACDNLPSDWGDGNAPGRLNRWAALLVKSRVCLFEGTWRKYHGGSNPDMWLREAADAAKELIDDGPYELYVTGDPEHDYNAIHRMTDLSGVPEVIYWRRYEMGILTNHVQSYSRSYNGGATKSLVEDYLCTDGLPISLSPFYQGDEEYESIFENRDPRLRQSILHPEDQPYYNYGNHDFEDYPYPRLTGMRGGQQIATGYHIIKVFEDGAAYAGYNTSATPAIVLRFAEGLLNYAEAKAELGTLTQEDLDMSINRLRDRVGMPHMTMDVPMDPRYAGDGVSALIAEIRRERRVELFFEGFRYDDIRRWRQGKKLETPDYGIRWDDNYRSRIDPKGKVTIQSSVVEGIEYLAPYKGTDYETPVFDENKHYLWPIPSGSISQNTNLEQTSGWK